MQEIASDIAAIASLPKTPWMMVIPGWLIRIMGLMDPLMKEIVEMLPNWQNDYTVDDSEFCKEFGVTATPADVALKEYVEFYKGVLAES